VSLEIEQKARLRKTCPATVLALALLISAMIGIQCTKFGTADPYPNFYTKITIESPQNTTYNVNTVTLNFSVESLNLFSYLNFSYSLDGQDLRAIENISTVSQDFIPINPGVYGTTLTGSLVFSNLTGGWHNITVYQIKYSATPDPPNGEIICSTSVKFLIVLEQEHFPTVLVAGASVASVAIVGVGLFCYFRKRNR
jgi:hypothetical protein